MHEMDKRPIAELQVSELLDLIQKSVKNTVMEVMLEFALEADAEAQIVFTAEINELLRQEMRGGFHAPLPSRKVDD